MKITILFILSSLFLSCTEDGKDGKAYISIDWEYQNDQYCVTGYGDTNPNTPLYINKNQNYETEPGTYEYSYTSKAYEKNYKCYGSYTIHINEGEKKSFFSDGDDGKDTYFKLYISVEKKSTGMTFDTVYSGQSYVVIETNSVLLSSGDID
jgi:hypothetical protein